MEKRIVTMIGKHGSLYTCNSKGENQRTFVFGNPLPEGVMRVEPFPYAGFAAIDARHSSLKDSIGQEYAKVVSFVAQALTIKHRKEIWPDRAKAGAHEANGLINDMVEALKDGRCPKTDFLWEVRPSKSTSLLPLLIHDVADELGMPSGVMVGKDELALYLCGTPIRIKGERIIIGELPKAEKSDYWSPYGRAGLEDAGKGKCAPIYDQAQIQSSLYSLAARERFLEGDLNGEIYLSQKALFLCPENAFVRCKVADALLQKGDVEMALEESKLAIRTNPYLDEAHNLAGRAFYKLGKHLDAIESYLDAVEYAGSDAKKATYLFNLAVCHFESGQFDDAINYLNQCISLEKNDADAYLLRSKAHHKLGHEKQAIDDLLHSRKLRETGSAGGNP